MKLPFFIPLLAIGAIVVTSLAFGLAVAGPFLYTLSPQGEIDPLAIHEQYDPRKQHGTFNDVEVNIAPSLFRDIVQVPSEQGPVLGISNGEKRIEVDLSKQRLYAFEGEQKVYDYLISSGLWGKTPTGEFRVWIKLRATRMTGGNKLLHTYYDLPNVPYTMFFANDQIARSQGFSIHGAYWHTNFGHPMSHGCINMKPEEAKQIYYWATPDLQGKSSIQSTPDNPGTRILIYGKAPVS